MWTDEHYFAFKAHHRIASICHFHIPFQLCKTKLQWNPVELSLTICFDFHAPVHPNDKSCTHSAQASLDFPHIPEWHPWELTSNICGMDMGCDVTHSPVLLWGVLEERINVVQWLLLSGASSEAWITAISKSKYMFLKELNAVSSGLYEWKSCCSASIFQEGDVESEPLSSSPQGLQNNQRCYQALASHSVQNKECRSWSASPES